MKIAIEHLARIEGHANLVIDTARGTLKELRLEIIESPRFFEAMLRGKHYSDVAPIVARICGVCSNSHTLVSLQATEQALGVEVSDQTRALRQLLAYGEILQSHLLQLFFMAIPDYYGVPSILPLVQSERILVNQALQLKKMANDICRVVGGRPVHPVTPAVGGFLSLPEAGELQELRRQLVAALPDLEASVDIFTALEYPDFERETEYFSLAGEGDYPVFGRQLVSSDGVNCQVENYADVLEEYLVPHSSAKFARLTRGSFMVGALSRLRNNFDLLSPMAVQVADALEVGPTTCNPYRILGARLVEVVHSIERAIHLIDDLLLAGLQQESLAKPQGPGRGVAAIEAPRGLLFHAYNYDAEGRIESADCVIPTAQNLGNIEADLRQRVPELFRSGREELTMQCEKLIRAYDPCISCSTHMLTVDYL